MEELKMSKKIAVVAANGRAAQQIISEAVERGLEVTAFGRHENNTQATSYVQKDVFDLTKADLQEFDAVVDAVGAWQLTDLYVISKAAAYLADLLKGTATRLLLVGGAGSLFVNPEHTSTLELQPDFPADYKPVSAAHGAALAILRASSDTKWTYVSPAADFQADGQKTGKYLLGGEEFMLNDRQQSVISYADYAVAMVDEIENGNHVQQRISVVEA